LLAWGEGGEKGTLAEQDPRLRFNNNPIERRNGDIKQRCKVMRGFKSFLMARAFIRLYVAVINFVRHRTKPTPAHRAGV
jgi:transposase-like protein